MRLGVLDRLSELRGESGLLCSLDMLRDMSIMGQAAKVRTYRQFAEEEIRIKEGPRMGRFRCSKQPFSGRVLDAFDSGIWNRHYGTGCVQSGKTLLFVVIPCLYHIFEIKEDVIVQAPTQDMCRDKYKKDILPLIRANPRFAQYLPTEGRGSRDGWTELVEFSHGPTIRFLSAGAGDTKRSGYTARVFLITEVDKQDTAGEASREADPVSQGEARTEAYGDEALIFGECTTSYTSGRIWSELKAGTDSRDSFQCVHCHEWMEIEREHFVDADGHPNEIEARENAHFACPKCGETLTDEHRKTMSESALMVSGDQRIENGKVVGDMPRTMAFSYRWGAFNNLFWTTEHLASVTYRRLSSANEESGDRYLRQFVWCIPWEPDLWQELELDGEALRGRQSVHRQGVVPDDVMMLSTGVDIGRHLLYYTTIAWCPGGRGYIIDYSEVTLPDPNQVGDDKAITTGLNGLHDLLTEGYRTAGGVVHYPKWIFVDAGAWTEVIYKHCRSRKQPWMAVHGRGAAESVNRFYHTPSGGKVLYEGLELQVRYHEKERCKYVTLNSDYWKTWLRRRFKIEDTSAEDTIVLFKTLSVKEHTRFCRHNTAEQYTEEAVPGKGVIQRWTNESRRHNHFGDSTYYACVSGQMFLMHQLELQRAASKERVKTRPASDPTGDDRPFFAAER